MVADAVAPEVEDEEVAEVLVPALVPESELVVSVPDPLAPELVAPLEVPVVPLPAADSAPLAVLARLCEPEWRRLAVPVFALALR